MSLTRRRALPRVRRRPGRQSRSSWAVISAASVAATCIAVGAVALRPAGGATATTVDQTVGQAVTYAQSTGVAAAIVVYDDQTGKLYTAGDYTSYYGSASVMKLFVATKLLATGQMQDPWIAGEAWSMITRSDDDALNALLPYVGDVEVINWVKDYYGIPFLGTTPHKPGCWGNTQITALGIAYFYRQMRHDPQVAPWLVNALHHHETYGADGTDQSFGIPQAAEDVGVKQGWGHCSSNTDGSVINSTGLVGSDRFAIAILSNTNNWTVDGNSFNAMQAAVVTQMAKILMPDGYVDLPEAHNPVGRVESVSAKGSMVTLTGWGLDPDTKASSMTVQVTEGTATRWQDVTSIHRADINIRYRTSGDHGFKAQFSAPNGSHIYCVRLLNDGMGNASPQYCYPVTVNGSPVAELTSITAATAGHVTVSGWAYDPDAVPNSTRVTVSIDAGTATASTSSLLANQARAAGSYKVAGNHGFGTAIAATAGTHRVCVSALNAGPTGAAAVSLGCVTVTVRGAAASTRPPTTGTPRPSPSSATTSPVVRSSTPAVSSSAPASTSAADPARSPSGN